MTASTVVVIGREAFSPTEATVRGIVANTTPPLRLVVVDGGSPRPAARRLELLARELDFTLLHSDAILSANESRNLGFAHVTTEFVVFVDNDLLVEHGWLEGLEQCARDTGADRIELYTGPYGSYHSDPARAAKELERLGKTADAAIAAGLQVNAGHDLVVSNLPALVKRIPALAEVSIGHGLTADALEYGMAGTVGRFLKACGW